MIWLRPEQVWTCNMTRHHRPLLSPSGSRNKLETPFCNARRILLRHKARDEISDHNSVPCQSLATLRCYGTLWRYKYVPTLSIRVSDCLEMSQIMKHCSCSVTSWRHVGLRDIFVLGASGGGNPRFVLEEVLQRCSVVSTNRWHLLSAVGVSSKR
jgi:hypothetical protein